MVRVSRVEVVVLGLLAEEPMHGYDLMERFRSRSMGFWVDVGRASVYQALRRMERDRLVVGRSQRGREGPDRRVFRITRAGRSRLRSGIAERVGALEPFQSEAGVALGFLDLPEAGGPREALARREAAVRDLMDTLTTERARLAGAARPGDTTPRLMLDRQEALARAELAWIRSARSALGRGSR